MTIRHIEIIEDIIRDGFLVRFGILPNPPACFAPQFNRISIDTAHFKGTVADYPDARLDLVLYHEWGHAQHYRGNPNEYQRLLVINNCHEDLEYEAYRFALDRALTDARGGNNLPLREAIDRYPAVRNALPNGNGRRVALERIINDPLWQQCLNQLGI